MPDPSSTDTTLADQAQSIQQPAISDDAKAFLESLKPSNLGKAPAPTQQAEPDPGEVSREEPQIPTLPGVPTRDKSAPVNFQKLRESKEQLERDYNLAKQELESLKTRVPAEEVDKIRTEFTEKLSAAEKLTTEQREKMFMLDARSSDEWKDRDTLVKTARTHIKEILDLPEIAEFEKLSVRDMGDPAKLNTALRALNAVEKFAEMDELRSHIVAQRHFTKERDEIEQRSAAARKTWESNKENLSRQRLSQTRQQLAAFDPALVPGTKEHEALPEETRKNINGAWDTVSREAQELMKAPPEVQLDHIAASKYMLAMTKTQNGNMHRHIATLSEENKKLAARLKAYESNDKAPAAVGAGGAAGSGGDLQSQLESMKIWKTK